MPSINSLLHHGARCLEAAGVDSPLFDSRELLQHSMKVDKISPAATDQPVTEAASKKFLDLIARRAARYPLQYLLGFWEFYGRRFNVREGVLIPRPDTETLVDLALSLFPRECQPAILDLCSGSGALGITLALEFPGSKVDALELSPAALEVLEENVRALSASVRVLAADALTWKADRRYDLIVCNPPYIAPSEYTTLQPEVLCEPQLALTASHDGYYFYEEIPFAFRNALCEGGVLLFEVGVGQSSRVASLLQNAGFQSIECRKDLCGIERAVMGIRPSLE